MSYERNSDSPFGYTYTVGFQVENNTPLLFCIESLLNCYMLILAVKQSISFGQFEPIFYLFKLFLRDQ